MENIHEVTGIGQAMAAFDFGGQVAGALRFGEGHINDTFAVYTQQEDTTAKRFILQRINTHVFANPAGLMENIVGVTEYLRRITVESGGDPDRETLTVLRTRAGDTFHTTADGGVWRAYLFIEDAVCYQAATPELFRASAEAYGNFARLLQSYPAGTLVETIPHFHDTPDRFRKLAEAIRADSVHRAGDCAAEIAFALAREEDCGTLTGLLAKGELPLRVTHNDTKLNNVLIDPKSQKGVAVIDLDTVMPGLAHNDYGDSIRFGASTAAEDERDLAKVHFSLPLFETYTAGYLHTAGAAMSPFEKEMLPWGARLMTLECGMRFLTDHLQGDTYFKIHRPGHNLDRCRTQFQLVRQMEERWDDMNAIVGKYSG